MTDQSAPDSGPSWWDNLTGAVSGFLSSKPQEVKPRQNVDMKTWSPVLTSAGYDPTTPEHKLLTGISEHINNQPMPEQPSWGRALATAGLGGLSAGLLRSAGAPVMEAAQFGAAPAQDLIGQRNKAEQAQATGWQTGGSSLIPAVTGMVQQGELRKVLGDKTRADAARIYGDNGIYSQPGAQPGSAPSAPNPQAPNQRVDFGRQVYDYFTGRGMTPQQSAAIAGNFAWESGGATDNVTKYDNRKYPMTPHSAGIGQWNDRLPALFDYARKSGINLPAIDFRDPNALKAAMRQIPLKTQLDFAWDEMQGKEGRAFAMIKSATGDTAQDFRRAGQGAISYHRPAGWTPAAYNNPELAERGHGFNQRMLLGIQSARASIAAHQQAAMQPGTSDLGGLGGGAPQGPGAPSPDYQFAQAQSGKGPGGAPAVASAPGANVATGSVPPAGGAPAGPQSANPGQPAAYPLETGGTPKVEPDRPMYKLGPNSPHAFYTPHWRDRAADAVQGALTKQQLSAYGVKLPGSGDLTKGPETVESILKQMHDADTAEWHASPAFQSHIELAKANAQARQKASSDAEAAVDKEATEAKLNNHTLDILDAAYQETKKKGVLGPGFGDELLQAGNNLLDRFNIPHANTGPVGVIGELANREAIQNMMSELAASGGTGPKGGQAMFRAFKAAVANSSQSPAQFESILTAMRAINADHIARQTAKNQIKQEDIRNGGVGLYEPWQHQERIDKYTQAVHQQALESIKQVLRTAPTPPAEEAAGGGAAAATAPPTDQQRQQIKDLVTGGMPLDQAVKQVRGASAPPAAAPAAAPNAAAANAAGDKEVRNGARGALSELLGAPRAEVDKLYNRRKGGRPMEDVQNVGATGTEQPRYTVKNVKPEELERLRRLGSP